MIVAHRSGISGRACTHTLPDPLQFSIRPGVISSAAVTSACPEAKRRTRHQIDPLFRGEVPLLRYSLARLLNPLNLQHQHDLLAGVIIQPHAAAEARDRRRGPGGDHRDAERRRAVYWPFDSISLSATRGWLPLNLLKLLNGNRLDRPRSSADHAAPVSFGVGRVPGAVGATGAIVGYSMISSVKS